MAKTEPPPGGGSSNVPEVQRKGTTDLQVGRPDFLKGQEVRGLELLGIKDMVLPRLSLAQSNTPQIKKNNEKYIPTLEEGMFFNQVTRQIYGTKVQVCPLFFFKSRIFFKDIDQGGGVICQAPPPDGTQCQMNNGGRCLHDKWGPKGEPPECNEFFNYPSLLLPSRELIVVSLKSTGLKAAKEWNSMMRLRNADTFAGIYEVSVKPARNKAGLDFYTFRIENAGWADEDLWRHAGNAYDMVFQGISTGTLTVETENIEAEQGSQAQEM